MGLQARSYFSSDIHGRIWSLEVAFRFINSMGDMVLALMRMSMAAGVLLYIKRVLRLLFHGSKQSIFYQSSCSRCDSMTDRSCHVGQVAPCSSELKFPSATWFRRPSGSAFRNRLRRSVPSHSEVDPLKERGEAGQQDSLLIGLFFNTLARVTCVPTDGFTRG